MMKRILLLLLCLCLTAPAALAGAETSIVLGDDIITVNGAPITEDPTQSVYLAREVETHPGVSAELAGLENRTVTITAAGSYRISGEATDARIAVRAGENDRVRLILDGVTLTCRTSSALQGYSAYDPRTPGEYGLTIELAEGSENVITGSHAEGDADLDGAVDSLVSLGFEGSGRLTVEADNEGVEVKYGHLTINGGVFHITAGDDPLNVSEDGVGTLTVNAGYLYSAVRATQGGEGDGIDSNGQIIFNGGTAINLAHPQSQDGGIDSDGGSYVNGGVIVGAGNMYDPIEADSRQLFMMLEFAQQTDDLLVVTDAGGTPVFAYDFPHSYTYIAFSSPLLREGESYRVYLGGTVEGTQTDGLYTEITAYTPGTLMRHGEGTAARTPGMDGMGNPGNFPQGGFDPGQGGPWLPDGLDLNVILADADLNELLAGKDLNLLLTGFSITDLLSAEQLEQYLGDADPAQLAALSRGRGQRGMDQPFGGAPRGMESSADVATTDFLLTRQTTGFTNIRPAQ